MVIEIASWKHANSDAATLGGHMGQMMRDAAPAMRPKEATTSTPPPAASAGQASPSAMKAPK